MNRSIVRSLLFCMFICCGFSAARAWLFDPSKPLIYEMRIAFETDKWINMYSTATVLSKSDNAVAFRVVADSTVTPTYQLVVTTQGNVGIGTSNPDYKFEVQGSDVRLAAFKGTATGPSGLIHIENANADASWNLGVETGSGWVGGGASGTFYIDKDNVGPQVAISSTGKVGIQNSLPSYTLDVGGDVNFTGSLYQNGSLASSMIKIVSAALSSVQTQTFSGLSSGKNYKLILSFVQNTSNGIPYIRFNADSSAHYNWELLAWATSGSVITGATATTQVYLSYPTAPTKAGYPVYMELSFSTVANVANAGAYGNINTTYWACDVSLPASATGGFSYTQTEVSTLTIGVSAGTMTGQAALYQVN